MSLGKQQFLDQAARSMKYKPTKHEAMLAERLNARWPKLFRPQWVMEDCILDFYSPLLNVAIEVDGKSHNSSNGRANDLLKGAILESRQARLLRFTNREIDKHFAEIVCEIEAVVSSIVPSNTRRQKYAWTAAGLPKEIRRKKHHGASSVSKPYADLV